MSRYLESVNSVTLAKVVGFVSVSVLFPLHPLESGGQKVDKVDKVDR